MSAMPDTVASSNAYGNCMFRAAALLNYADCLKSRWVGLSNAFAHPTYCYPHPAWKNDMGAASFRRIENMGFPMVVHTDLGRIWYTPMPLVDAQHAKGTHALWKR